MRPVISRPRGTLRRAATGTRVKPQTTEPLDLTVEAHRPLYKPQPSGVVATDPPRDLAVAAEHAHVRRISCSGDVQDLVEALQTIDELLNWPTTAPPSESGDSRVNSRMSSVLPSSGSVMAEATPGGNVQDGVVCASGIELGVDADAAASGLTPSAASDQSLISGGSPTVESTLPAPVQARDSESNPTNATDVSQKNSGVTLRRAAPPSGANSLGTGRALGAQRSRSLSQVTPQRSRSISHVASQRALLKTAPVVSRPPTTIPDSVSITATTAPSAVSSATSEQSPDDTQFEVDPPANTDRVSDTAVAEKAPTPVLPQVDAPTLLETVTPPESFPVEESLPESPLEAPLSDNCLEAILADTTIVETACCDDHPPNDQPKDVSPAPTKPTLVTIPQGNDRPVLVTEKTTNQRVSRILEYLKTVESDTGATAGYAAGQPSPPRPAGPQPVDTVAESVLDGVKAKVVAQQLELENQVRTVTALRGELQRQREANREQHEQSRKELRSKLGLQRKEYEAVVKRHLAFVDKLLREKEALAKQCEDVTGQVSRMETKWASKQQALEDQHQRDLKQQRELWQAGEKIRKEKWMGEHTKRIKEQTVKGLEPEIQRMLAQHKQQLRQAEDAFHAQLGREKDALAETYQTQLQELHNKLASERQRACEEEREFARQRYQAQLEREELEWAQSKRKLGAELQAEREAACAALRAEMSEMAAAHKRAADELRREIEREKAGRAEALDAQQRRHNADVGALRDRLEQDRDEWRAQMVQRKEDEFRLKEKVFKEKLLKERDAEIEMVVARLESESSSSSSDIYRRHRLDVERLATQHAEELKGLRDQHSIALDKVLASQQALSQSEQARNSVQKELLQTQTALAAVQHQLASQRADLERLRVAEGVLVERIRRDFAGDLERRDLAAKGQQRDLEIAEQKLRDAALAHSVDLEHARHDKDRALQMIEDRVRKAVLAKEEVIRALRQQLSEQQLRCSTLEGLIEKQRQELLL